MLLLPRLVPRSIIPPEIISNTNLDNYIVIISRLSASTEYTVSVTAATRIREGEAVLRMLMTDPFAASSPDIALTEVNSTSVRVEWSYTAFPKELIVGYLIEVTRETMTVVDTRNVTLPILNDNSSQTALVTGLSPFTLYIFRVRAYSYETEPVFIHLGGMAEDCLTTLEAGEWKDCFMTIQVVCVFGWGVGGRGRSGGLVGFFSSAHSV